MSLVKILKFSLLSFMFIGLLASCKKDDDTSEEERIARMIDELRDITAAYVDHEAALAAGWSTDLSGCVEHPTEGGMGHHFARLEYMDGRVNHKEPQVLLYVPDGQGGMEFVAVEYIVPFDILPETEEAPELFGQHFHKNHEQKIWALHVWTAKDNPSGMFYDWNPDVSCQ